MTDWEAIEKRISCRAYEDKLIDEKTLTNLKINADILSKTSGLNLQLIYSSEEGKPAIQMAKSMFSGPVYAYLALVGAEDNLSAEKVGYFGESFVLYATRLGLGTCWVASTYDKNSISPVISEGEKLWSVITIGYAMEKTPLKQKMIRGAIRKSNRKIEKFLESDTSYEELPEWIQKGIKAILLGPSAVNQQPVNIVYKDGNVSAKLWKAGNGLEYIDLGIAKKQFQAAAASAGHDGTFAWRDGGSFTNLVG